VILCLCPSPAVDVTYQVAHLGVGRANRVGRVTRRPGGKAVNVAGVLTALGEPALVLAPVAGTAGAEFRTGLTELGMAADLVDAGSPTRQTVTVVDQGSGEATMFSEPAAVRDWPVLADRFAALLPTADVVVISGSLPDGAGAGALAGLIGAARAAGRPVVVDTSGPALAEAVAAAPTVVKPNAEELAELTGQADPRTAVGTLLGRGPRTVVASLGADGVLAAGLGGCWRARPARPLRGNPTGAGDALVAALARGLLHGTELPEVLADGVALSAAAVLRPHAGDVDPADVQRQRTGVTVETLEVTR
jgi:1-phosphofructokinase family hexose kinase